MQLLGGGKVAEEYCLGDGWWSDGWSKLVGWAMCDGRWLVWWWNGGGGAMVGIWLVGLFD